MLVFIDPVTDYVLDGRHRRASSQTRYTRRRTLGKYGSRVQEHRRYYSSHRRDCSSSPVAEAISAFTVTCATYARGCISSCLHSQNLINLLTPMRPLRYSSRSRACSSRLDASELCGSPGGPSGLDRFNCNTSLRVPATTARTRRPASLRRFRSKDDHPVILPVHHPAGWRGGSPLRCTHHLTRI